MLPNEIIEDLINEHVKDNFVVSFGTGKFMNIFVSKLALKVEQENLNVKVVPTSQHMNELLHDLGLEISSLEDKEIDVAFDFVDMVDENFNYISLDSTSLVRDKMIAQSAETMIIIVPQSGFVKNLKDRVLFEISTFGYKRTLIQLMNLGIPTLKKQGNKPVKTESGNYLVEVLVDEIHDTEDLEFQSKNIPGVLESGLFLDYADKVVLHNGSVKVKTRVNNFNSNLNKSDSVLEI